jgi:hypothetical protein
MASPAPVATPVALGPGRLGQRYRIVCCLSNLPNGKPAGNFADVYRVELELHPPTPQPQPRTYAAKVSRRVPDATKRRRDSTSRQWEHEIKVMQRVREADCPHLAAVVDHFADEATGRLCIV